MDVEESNMMISVLIIFVLIAAGVTWYVTTH